MGFEQATHCVIRLGTELLTPPDLNTPNHIMQHLSYHTMHTYIIYDIYTPDLNTPNHVMQQLSYHTMYAYICIGEQL